MEFTTSLKYNISKPRNYVNRYFYQNFIAETNAEKKQRFAFDEALNCFVHYSVLNATTGSFLAALLDGIMPEMRVSNTLIKIRTRATPIGSCAFRLVNSVKWKRMRFIGMQSR